jgi:hypothetical protein
MVACIEGNAQVCIASTQQADTLAPETLKGQMISLKFWFRFFWYKVSVQMLPEKIVFDSKTLLFTGTLCCWLDHYHNVYQYTNYSEYFLLNCLSHPFRMS